MYTFVTYYGVQGKEDEVVTACSKHGDEKCLSVVVGKPETT
jgi:hypothetical protein